ncbi:hypothetical protein M427DRAFT_458539 [Gonapodya prolifera JEL478]|uniref:Secreted protein n=1 Tax=Gonapodya prolifera (strain JEL478) TaxID=1344416 RepID=A0A139A289_GONPJ|nr:hypothetical protein M427DRAFT_458539 [Gonapodya prolifera JEL478]|eukprot:KXS10854.1 hypothetical protein M427DRAFT_458539 [Gonapodya prolifera JEL478]
MWRLRVWRCVLPCWWGLRFGSTLRRGSVEGKLVESLTGRVTILRVISNRWSRWCRRIVRSNSVRRARCHWRVTSPSSFHVRRRNHWLMLEGRHLHSRSASCRVRRSAIRMRLHRCI